MFQLTINLTQLTPILQFQSEQDGALLRITEFKPKFDRYLLENCKSQIEEVWIRKTNNHRSLDYKAFILPVNPDIWQIKGQFPCYFGNMGDAKPNEEKQMKHLAYTDEIIKLHIQTKFEKMIKVIEKNIAGFIVATNFGTRQSKGFGGFFLENNQDFETELKDKFDLIYKKEIRLNDTAMSYNSFFNIFKEIEKEYKLLKAGDAGQKKESKLREYFNSLNPIVEWEKPLMQKKVQEITGGKMNIKNSSSNYQYVRALLGLAETFEYPKFGKLKFTVTQIPDGLSQDNKVIIERFKSPITFKFYKGAIYLCCKSFSDDQKNIFNKSFEFKPNSDSRSFNLKTPIQFELLEFIKSSKLDSRKWRRII